MGSLSTIAEHKRTFDAQQAGGSGPAPPDPTAHQRVAGGQTYWQELEEAAEADVSATGEAATAEVASLKEHVSAAEPAYRPAAVAKPSRVSLVEIGLIQRTG